METSGIWRSELGKLGEEQLLGSLAKCEGALRDTLVEAMNSGEARGTIEHASLDSSRDLTSGLSRSP